MSNYDYNAENREQKFFDRGEANYEIRNTGTLTLLFSPRLGADFDKRIGRLTCVRSIFIRGKLQIYQAAIFPPSAFFEYSRASLNRMILLVDWQSNGAAPAITDILVNANPESQLNPNNRRRFTIIKDKQWAFGNYQQDIGNGQLNCSTPPIYPVKIYERVNIEQVFNSNDFGDIRDHVSGSIYMLLIGSNPAAVPNIVQLNCSIRCRYDDY